MIDSHFIYDENYFEEFLRACAKLDNFGILATVPAQELSQATWEYLENLTTTYTHCQGFTVAASAINKHTNSTNPLPKFIRAIEVNIEAKLEDLHSTVLTLEVGHQPWREVFEFAMRHYNHAIVIDLLPNATLDPLLRMLGQLENIYFRLHMNQKHHALLYQVCGPLRLVWCSVLNGNHDLDFYRKANLQAWQTISHTWPLTDQQLIAHNNALTLYHLTHTHTNAATHTNPFRCLC